MAWLTVLNQENCALRHKMATDLAPFVHLMRQEYLIELTVRSCGDLHKVHNNDQVYPRKNRHC